MHLSEGRAVGGPGGGVASPRTSMWSAEPNARLVVSVIRARGPETGAKRFSPDISAVR